MYTVLQPDVYNYKMWVVDDLGVYSLGSNQVAANYTVPQVEYPFSDDIEGGSGASGAWEWSAPWGPTSTAHSPLRAWADSPVGFYENNANTALTTSVDLAGAAAPVLTFWHKTVLEQGDFGYVEISTNGGVDWSRVFSATGIEDWNQEKIDLSPYAGQVLFVRFRLQANGQDRADGWFLDDIRMADGLLAVGYPYFDNMDSGSGAWFYDSPWGRTDDISFSGNWSWTDSPDGVYANNISTSLRIRIDLSPANMPVLQFMHRHSLQENRDWGLVEVSTNSGASWKVLYSRTGGQADWKRAAIDLSDYAGNANVLIRFRVKSDGSTTNDGWYVDDVRVSETTAPVLGYPYTNDMEGPTGDWIASSWGLTVDSYGGDFAWSDSPLGNYALDIWSDLILSNVLDLGNAVNPQLTFWHKYDIYNWNRSYEPGSGHNHYVEEHDRGRLHISNFFGRAGTWEPLATFWGVVGDWTRFQVDIPSKYVGLNTVRIKFVLDDSRDTYTSSGINNHRIQLLPRRDGGQHHTRHVDILPVPGGGPGSAHLRVDRRGPGWP